jgi:hypothetical protein
VTALLFVAVAGLIVLAFAFMPSRPKQARRKRLRFPEREETQREVDPAAVKKLRDAVAAAIVREKRTPRLVPFACDIFALRRIVGIGVPLGEPIFDRIIERRRASVDEHDRSFASAIGGGAPTMQQALRRVILGPRYDGGHGWVFGYALSIVLEDVGERLDNATVSAASLESLDEIDRALEHVGIPEPFRLSRLAFSGPPVLLPKIDDVPAIGWIESSAVKAAHQAFEAAKLDADDPALSPATRAALEEIRSWTARANGRGLVGFYF